MQLMATAERSPQDLLAEFEDEFASLLAVLDPDEVLRRVVARIPDIVGLEKGFVGLRMTDGSMTISHLHGLRTNALDGLRIDPGRGVGGKVLASDRPSWVKDYGASGEITHHYDSWVVAKEGIRGLVAVPLYTGTRLQGVLYAATSTLTDLGDRAADSLKNVAGQAAVALAIAERAKYAAEVAAHEERRRISLSLHDTVGATLFALTASVQSLGEELHQDPVLRARIDGIAQRAHDASVALRQSLRALSAPPRGFGLADALRSDCRAFQQRAGIPARLILMDDLPEVEDCLVEALVAIVREGLRNVEKHAQARSVVVSTFPSRDGLAIAISDDGIGLGQATSDGLGIGLSSAAEQLSRIKGTLTIAENDDGGTTMRAWVPC